MRVSHLRHNAAVTAWWTSWPTLTTPRRLGERLSGLPYFKYRFGNYRLIYDFSRRLELLELYDVGKRSRVYD